MNVMEIMGPDLAKLIQLANANSDYILSLLQSNKNNAINGNFLINQLVLSGTVTLAAGAYGHDMWKAGSGGCTYTFATVNNVTTITIISGSLVQVIEGVNLFSGTYTLSWIGTAQGKIGAGGYGSSGITGTAVGGTNLPIEFNAGTLSKVQFNAGAVALPFQPRSKTVEELLCLRYYEKSYDVDVAPGTATLTGGIWTMIETSEANRILLPLRWRVRKRIAPIVTLYSTQTGASGKVLNRSTAADVAVSSTGSSETGIQFNALAAAQTVGQQITLQYTADARL